MAQIFHKRATTTHAIRAEIQRSTESAATLSRRYGINPKTVRKWRSRDTVEDVQVPYFLLFGAFLQRFGGSQLFMDLLMLLVGRFRGGMAKVSIVSSTLFGSASSSATANIALMGTDRHRTGRRSAR